MELKELGQLLKEYNSRVYRIRRLTMAKKFLKLDGDKLSQVLEFKDGQRIEVPLNMDGSIRWYKDKMKNNDKTLIVAHLMMVVVLGAIGSIILRTIIRRIYLKWINNIVHVKCYKLRGTPHNPISLQRNWKR